MDDKIANSVAILSGFIEARGDRSAKWHWNVVLEGMRRAETDTAEQIKALADALEHVHKASVNERVWNDATGKVDDMQKIVAHALLAVGRLK